MSSALAAIRRLAIVLALLAACGVKSSPHPPPLGAPEPAPDASAACAPTIAPVSESEPADAGARAP